MFEDHTQTVISAHASPQQMVRLDVKSAGYKFSIWLDRKQSLELRRQITKAHGRTSNIKMLKTA